jgi:hypothetical protein
MGKAPALKNTKNGGEAGGLSAGETGGVRFSIFF